MNILLDQNISFRVTSLLGNIFGNVRHVKELGLTDYSDLEIWNFAYKNNYTIITFDSDFIDLANLKGTPPKIIWLRFGNSTNLKIANKLISNEDVIIDFVAENDSEISFLEID
jgi:predicted nuclease of predicted toxin-antitoxin system